MKGSIEFKISRGGEHPAEFYLHERCFHECGRIESVRRCLEEHRISLLDRIAALDAILASAEPERANQMLLDNPVIQIDEVTLRAPTSTDRFETLMRTLKQSD
jgi:hypothetical protein